MYHMKKGGTAKSKKQQAAIAMSMKAAGKKPKMKAGGSLKEVPSGNKGLRKLPTKVRNQMGFKKDGGITKYVAGGPIDDVVEAGKKMGSKAINEIKKRVPESVKSTVKNVIKTGENISDKVKDKVSTYRGMVGLKKGGIVGKSKKK